MSRHRYTFLIWMVMNPRADLTPKRTLTRIRTWVCVCVFVFNKFNLLQFRRRT